MSEFWYEGTAGQCPEAYRLALGILNEHKGIKSITENFKNRIDGSLYVTVTNMDSYSH